MYACFAHYILPIVFSVRHGNTCLTYLLTPWCRVLLEKLTGLQLVKKFPAFYGIRRFITALASVRHLSLSCASPIQSTHPHPTSWRSILILSTHLRLGLPSGLFPSGFPTKTLYAPLTSPIRFTCPAHLITRGENTKINYGMGTTGEKKKGRPRKTWMEGVQAAMTTGNLETDQWRNREEWRLVSGRRRQLLKKPDR